MKKRFAAAAAALVAAVGMSALVGCSHTVTLTDYVSEYRSNIYSGTLESYSVFATYSEREYPYIADGNVGDMTSLFEVTLAVSDNTKTYEISFSCGGKEYTADLSFDSVRMVHCWSQSMEEPTENKIVFSIRDADDADAESVTVTATSLRDENTLSLSDLLTRVSAEKQARFEALTDGSSFAGELYVRLLAGKTGCLYYVGLIDRTGNTYAMLADATTGEVLASHEN